MSPRQRAALGVVRDYIRAFNTAPTRVELGKRLGITAVSAHLLVDKLVRDGYLVREQRAHRNLSLTRKGATA